MIEVGTWVKGNKIFDGSKGDLHFSGRVGRGTGRVDVMAVSKVRNMSDTPVIC